MAPEARIDDGRFDIVVVGPLSRWSLISTFPKIFRGTHGENAAVQFFQATSADIHTQPQKKLLPDGEIFGNTPTKISILPHRLRYFINSRLQARQESNA